MCGSGRGLLVLAGVALIGAVGCVSTNAHRGLKAAHRTLQAEKEALSQSLFDTRTQNEALQTRLESVQRENQTKSELISNLQRENELLDEMRKTARGELEAMASHQALTDISISGPRLPASLHDALQQFASEHPTSVEYDAARGTVKWKADLLFALGSDVVKETSKDPIRRFSEIIRSPAAADFEVIVAGHTDNKPIARATTKTKHPTNWHLSAHRAIAVARILQSNGYAPERIATMGFGEYRPIADNATPAGTSQNRRVEIYIAPKGTIARVSTVAISAPRGQG